MLIFWVTGPHAGRIVTQWRYCKQSKEWRGQTYRQTLLYGPKYRSSDAIPAPEVFLLIPLMGIICPIKGVLLRDGIFQKGNYGSDEGHFSPINGLESIKLIQFSLCGIPTNLIFAHRVILSFLWSFCCRSPLPFPFSLKLISYVFQHSLRIVLSLLNITCGSPLIKVREMPFALKIPRIFEPVKNSNTFRKKQRILVCFKIFRRINFGVGSFHGGKKVSLFWISWSIQSHRSGQKNGKRGFFIVSTLFFYAGLHFSFTYTSLSKINFSNFFFLFIHQKLRSFFSLFHPLFYIRLVVFFHFFSCLFVSLCL